MSVMNIALIIALVSIAVSNAFAQEPELKWSHYRGMCDASAVEFLTDDLFVTGNDEDNVLRIYSRSAGGLPAQTLDFSPFYRLQKKKAEIDLEGSAKLGDAVYWISSHGANAKGKLQPSRHRFFAMQVVTNGSRPGLKPVGMLYTGLLRDLISEPSLASLNLAAAARKPPKARDALNIEGLAATPEGHLLIGFRNPIPQGKALILPLLNPQEVTAGRRARFGGPVMLDLGGLGVRSMVSVEDGYLIVAGSFDSQGRSTLYHWDGGTGKPRLLTATGLPGNPEALAVVEHGGERSLFVLNDDGTRQIGGEDCKRLKDVMLRTFRAYTMPMPR
jgi:hypothetical protein